MKTSRVRFAATIAIAAFCSMGNSACPGGGNVDKDANKNDTGVPTSQVPAGVDDCEQSHEARMVVDLADAMFTRMIAKAASETPGDLAYAQASMRSLAHDTMIGSFGNERFRKSVTNLACGSYYSGSGGVKYEVDVQYDGYNEQKNKCFSDIAKQDYIDTIPMYWITTQPKTTGGGWALRYTAKRTRELMEKVLRGSKLVCHAGPKLEVQADGTKKYVDSDCAYETTESNAELNGYKEANTLQKQLDELAKAMEPGNEQNWLDQTWLQSKLDLIDAINSNGMTAYMAMNCALENAFAKLGLPRGSSHPGRGEKGSVSVPLIDKAQPVIQPKNSASRAI